MFCTLPNCHSIKLFLINLSLHTSSPHCPPRSVPRSLAPHTTVVTKLSHESPAASFSPVLHHLGRKQVASLRLLFSSSFARLLHRAQVADDRTLDATLVASSSTSCSGHWWCARKWCVCPPRCIFEKNDYISSKNSLLHDMPSNYYFTVCHLVLILFHHMPSPSPCRPSPSVDLVSFFSQNCQNTPTFSPSPSSLSFSHPWLSGAGSRGVDSSDLK